MAACHSRIQVRSEQAFTLAILNIIIPPDSLCLSIALSYSGYEASNIRMTQFTKIFIGLVWAFYPHYLFCFELYFSSLCCVHEVMFLLLFVVPTDCTVTSVSARRAQDNCSLSLKSITAWHSIVCYFLFANLIDLSILPPRTWQNGITSARSWPEHTPTTAPLPMNPRILVMNCGGAIEFHKCSAAGTQRAFSQPSVLKSLRIGDLHWLLGVIVESANKPLNVHYCGMRIS